MGECWMNVYPSRDGTHAATGRYTASREGANIAACGVAAADPWMLRAAGVGYRVRIRLKPDAMVKPDPISARVRTAAADMLSSVGRC